MMRIIEPIHADDVIIRTMISERKITIAGKEVNLSYCYATEIGFKILAGEDISEFAKEVLEAIQNKVMPDTEKSIFLIIAAAQSYSESHEEKEQINSSDLMFKCSPEELATALGTIIVMKAEFYNLPKGEESEPQTEEERKEAEKNV